MTIKEGALSSFATLPCYDQQSDLLRFTVDNFEINVVLGICDNNLSGWDVVHDVATLSQAASCAALIDISGHYKYPVEVTYRYVFREILLAHERRHRADFETTVGQWLPDLQKKIAAVTVKCAEVQSVTEAATKGRNKLIPLFYSFLTSVVGSYKHITNTQGYEETTQLSVDSEIRKLRNKLLTQCFGGSTP